MIHFLNLDIMYIVTYVEQSHLSILGTIKKQIE